MAFESVLKASHLNITKNVVNAVGSQMMMQSSIFGRLGEFACLKVFKAVVVLIGNKA